MNYYIGYASLEAFLASCEPGAPLFVTLAEVTNKGPYGVPLREFEVRVFQIRSDSLAHYWLWRVGHEIGPHRDDKTRARALSAYEAVKAVLEERGLPFHEATVAVPKDLVLQGGGTGLVEYDKESGRFYHRAS